MARTNASQPAYPVGGHQQMSKKASNAYCPESYVALPWPDTNRRHRNRHATSRSAAVGKHGTIANHVRQCRRRHSGLTRSLHLHYHRDRMVMPHKHQCHASRRRKEPHMRGTNAIDLASFVTSANRLFRFQMAI